MNRFVVDTDIPLEVSSLFTLNHINIPEILDWQILGQPPCYSYVLPGSSAFSFEEWCLHWSFHHFVAT